VNVGQGVDDSQALPVGRVQRGVAGAVDDDGLHAGGEGGVDFADVVAEEEDLVRVPLLVRVSLYVVIVVVVVVGVVVTGARGMRRREEGQGI
jgi:hypothetical protein